MSSLLDCFKSLMVSRGRIRQEEQTRQSAERIIDRSVELLKYQASLTAREADAYTSFVRFMHQ